jgi:hypothetical protein
MKNDAPTGTTSTTGSRPGPVDAALLILGLVIALTLAGPLLPSSEGQIVFGIVCAGIASIAAAGLYVLRRWGYIMTIIVAALLVLLDAPAVFVASTPLLKVAAATVVVACVATLLLVTRPEARAAYR